MVPMQPNRGGPRQTPVRTTGAARGHPAALRREVVFGLAAFLAALGILPALTEAPPPAFRLALRASIRLTTLPPCAVSSFAIGCPFCFLCNRSCSAVS